MVAKNPLNVFGHKHFISEDRKAKDSFRTFNGFAKTCKITVGSGSIDLQAPRDDDGNFVIIDYHNAVTWSLHSSNISVADCVRC